MAQVCRERRIRPLAVASGAGAASSTIIGRSRSRGGLDPARVVHGGRSLSSTLGWQEAVAPATPFDRGHMAETR
jgi:hypothetical protein